MKSEEIAVSSNKLYLCAHNRLVDTKELDKYITNLDREIFDKSGFWYIGVLRGKYLDDNVDMNIYNSTKNVNLNTIISYIKDGEVHSFMDNYDEDGLKKQENID